MYEDEDDAREEIHRLSEEIKVARAFGQYEEVETLTRQLESEKRWLRRLQRDRTEMR